MTPQASHTPLGKLTAEIVQTGYGPRFVVQFDRPMPVIRNRGLNVYQVCGMETIQLDQSPDLLHTSNTGGYLAREMGYFAGHIIAKFTNGQTTLFIQHDHSAYDSDLKRYTAPVFTVQG